MHIMRNRGLLRGRQPCLVLPLSQCMSCDIIYCVVPLISHPTQHGSFRTVWYLVVPVHRILYSASCAIFVTPPIILFEVSCRIVSYHVVSYAKCREWPMSTPQRGPICRLDQTYRSRSNIYYSPYRLLTLLPMLQIQTRCTLLHQLLFGSISHITSTCSLLSFYVSAKVIIRPEYSNVQYCLYVRFHAQTVVDLRAHMVMIVNSILTYLSYSCVLKLLPILIDCTSHLQIQITSFINNHHIQRSRLLS